MDLHKPTLDYEPSEFERPKRLWRFWPMVIGFAAGGVVGFFANVFVIGIVSAGRGRPSQLALFGVPLAVGVVLGLLSGREPPKRRRIARPVEEATMMIRCRDCGQLTRHVFRRQSSGQYTKVCTECFADCEDGSTARPKDGHDDTITEPEAP